MVLKVLTSEDPFLREKAIPVVYFDGEASPKRLLEEMKATLKVEGGIGLAAPQVGIGLRIIIVCVGGKPEGMMQAFINPEIIYELGKQVNVEGCLSIPGKHGEVRRAFKVRVRAQSVNGKVFEYAASGLEAACLQHECQHLNGVLFVDLPQDSSGIYIGTHEDTLLKRT